jgi:hypothetical protein
MIAVHHQQRSSDREQKVTARVMHGGRRMKIHHAIIFLVACGGDSGELDPDVVTNLPPGDATGTALGGRYSMSSLTTDCSGDCTTNIDGFVYAACDVGVRLDDTVVVTQADGALKIDVEDNDYVSRLEGGVFASSMFEVGGVRTQYGGSVTIAARVTGTITSTLSGTARLRVSGQGLDCVIESEVSGEKR